MRASRGQIKIADILKENGLNFVEEYSFSDLVSESGRPLRFDFAVFDDEGELDFLIQFQGIKTFCEVNSGQRLSLLSQKTEEILQNHLPKDNLIRSIKGKKQYTIKQVKKEYLKKTLMFLDNTLNFDI